MHKEINESYICNEGSMNSRWPSGGMKYPEKVKPFSKEKREELFSCIATAF